MKQQIQPAHNALEQALSKRIQATRHAINFLSLFVIALLKTKTSNLAQVAVGFPSAAKSDSSYKRIQRFLKTNFWKDAGIELLMLEMLGLTGKLKLIIDRTEWKFGKQWVNILTVAVVFRGVAIPLWWEVLNHKGNASGEQHVAIVRRAVARIGVEQIEYVLADREFGNQEWLEFLIGKELDFRIRLKKSHLANRVSFERIGRKQPAKTRSRSRGAVAVFGLKMFIKHLAKSNTVFRTDSLERFK